MKKSARILALVLCTLMTVSIFAACSDDKEVSTGGKFTYWAPMWITSTETLSSYSEMMMYQEICKATGTEVEFIHPAQGTTGSEAFQILLSAGDYPDMIEYGWSTYAGGPDQAIKDGVIIALNDYMKDYAPNYYDYMEGEKGKANGNRYKAQSLTIEGNYFGFRNLNIGDYRGFQGFMVRKDLIDKWGIDIPVTIDDWENLFKAAKENGVKYPFTGGKGVVNNFATAWKLNGGFYVDGKTVKYGPFQEDYKLFLAKISDWLKKGYIDIDYVTNGNVEYEGALTNGNSIATCGYIGSVMGKLLPAMQEKNPEYELVACPWPVLKEGDTPWFQEVQAEAADSTIAISVQCGADDEDRYKEAIRWCDYVYSEEGAVLKSFGIEGKTYTIEKDEDGKEHYVYTDAIYDFEKIGAHSVDAALWYFMRPANAPGPNQHTDYLMGMYSYQQQKDALGVFNLYVDEAKKHVLPPLQYTIEEAEKKANIEVKGKDNFTAALENIILGKQPIESLDKAIEQVKKDGYDELLKIQQAAYDRYLKVLEDN